MFQVRQPLEGVAYKVVYSAPGMCNRMVPTGRPEAAPAGQLAMVCVSADALVL